MRIAKAAGQQVQVYISPLPVDEQWKHFDRRCATVLVVATNSVETWSEQQLRAAFELTAAEAKLTRLLASGNSSTEIARALSIQPNSVRVHLKSIYAKTGAHSQAELVRMLLSAGPTGS